jgi:hypothetical protein
MSIDKYLGKETRVNDDNYFTKTGHYSNSFIKSWENCPFSTTSDTNNIFNKNFFIGHFVEDLICGGDGNEVLNREDYKDNVLTKAGKPLAFVTASRYYADVVLQDQGFMKWINDINSEFQVILTGVLGGFKFKCAIDVLNLKGFEGGNPFILDLKTTGKPLNNLVWVENDEGKNVKVPFIEAWGYHTQLAIYREIVFQNYDILCDIHIGVVTKTIPADKEIIDMTDAFDYPYLIRGVIAKCKKIDYEMKMNIIEKCGTCDDCIKAKKINGSIPYKEKYNLR